jgi:hypothetical protein
VHLIFVYWLSGWYHGIMSNIPLNSLCVLVGDDLFRRASIASYFEKRERVEYGRVVQDLCGEVSDRNSIEHIVVDEMAHRTRTLLRLGNRVVLDSMGMSRKSYRLLQDKLADIGVPIYNLSCSKEKSHIWRSAEELDVMSTEPNLVTPVPREDCLGYIARNHKGVTVIGDIHGESGAFKRALEWAERRDHFLCFLGDILDYGPDGLEIADEVYRLVARGRAILIAGNHERKIVRWADGYRVRLSEGNQVTIRALSRLSRLEKDRWLNRFRGLYQMARMVQPLGDAVLAHAAVHPAYWQGAEWSSKMEQYALFGELDQTRSQPNRPVASYDWTSAIPRDRFVVVGHNIRSRRFPVTQTNEAGGTTLFLDTGSGKGGVLSSADFRIIDNNYLRLENFNIH